MLRVCPFGTKSSFRTGQGSRLAAGFRWTGPIYCTGDWDEARQAEHAAAVTLSRP